ncbi:hypothetical protein HDA32_005275 [Spinactinospora alkalitolerans]|uniref:Uncharacterized protein n=1 Tax=Spinactinospora alkalitolerans TaxID=687207 RepID=A0A852U3T8_9ACTN|nr:hypothetical protein [Spinactinospora alkalitolerans]NYE50155.1 hypothetical protein [Spinactinospora alkalitolerans]
MRWTDASSWLDRLLRGDPEERMSEQDHYDEGAEHHDDDDGTFGVGPVPRWGDDEDDEDHDSLFH